MKLSLCLNNHHGMEMCRESEVSLYAFNPHHQMEMSGQLHPRGDSVCFRTHLRRQGESYFTLPEIETRILPSSRQ